MAGREGVAVLGCFRRPRRRRMLPPLQPPVALLFALLPLISSAISVKLPSHGCYWTESCQSKWIGGCGSGLVITEQSNDCNGLCGEARQPPCLPFHTHFQCCKPESPRASDRCASCHDKLDFGEEYICCTDCSQPFLIDENSKLGYCKSGAQLAVQLKPQEIFKWVAGPWMTCSSPCDGGVRYRDVGCYGSIDDASIRHYPADDSMCYRIEKKPAGQETCNVKSCGEFGSRDPGDGNGSGMSCWIIMLLVLFGLIAAAGLGFGGYVIYKRRTSAPNGFVYIMLDGYS